MAWSLQDIQTQIASETDGNATISTTSTDWFNRLAPINRALFDYAETYDWRDLLKVYNGLISTSTANASVALPANFRRMEGFPKVAIDALKDGLPIVGVADNYKYLETDRFVNLLGNDYTGRTMYVHGATLGSGASVQFTYWAFPTSLASIGQLVECPDPTYVVQRALYYIYKSREDGRFPEAKVEADKIMARMIENENNQGVGYVDRRVGATPLNAFRIGRD